MNARWHATHLLSKTATLAERIAWHKEHAKECACRPVPENLQALMTRGSRAAKATRAKPRAKASRRAKR